MIRDHARGRMVDHVGMCHKKTAGMPIGALMPSLLRQNMFKVQDLEHATQPYSSCPSYCEMTRSNSL